MRRLRILAATGAALLITSTVIASDSQPAAAANPCGVYWHSQATNIMATPVTPNKCYMVQARMMRFYNGAPYTYYGALSSSISSVTATNGVNSGNHVRLQVSIGSNLTVWYRAPY